MLLFMKFAHVFVHVCECCCCKSCIARCFVLRLCNPEIIVIYLTAKMQADKQGSLMPYLRQADATFRNGFENEELKHIFIQNTFEEIKGEEAELCVVKTASFILEAMINEAGLSIVLHLFKVLKNQWTEISCDQRGCHIVQALYRRLITLIQYGNVQENEIKEAALDSLFEISADSLMRNMTDDYATHSLRSHFQMLGGMCFATRKDKHDNKKPPDIVLEKQSIPKPFLKTLQNINRTLCDIDQKKFVELLTDMHVSPCIVCLIRVISTRQLPKTLTRICKKILSSCQSADSNNTLFLLMKDRHSSHIFEALFEYADVSTIESVTDVMTSNRMKVIELSIHPIANFVVQKMIRSFDNIKTFTSFFNIALEGFEDILADQNYGVIQKIAEKCVSFPACQEKFISKLLEAFHCESVDKRKYLMPLVASGSTFEAFFGGDIKEGPPPSLDRVEYHGSLLLQTLLKFDNIGLIVSSVCESPCQHLLKLAMDCSGSHFIDCFISSSKLKLKKKRQLIDKLLEHSVTLSCDKYGSRVLENIWNSSDTVIKAAIVESLSSSEDQLSQDGIGKFIARKFSIKQYKTQRSRWEALQKQNSKKRKMFENIVKGSGVKKSKH